MINTAGGNEPINPRTKYIGFKAFFSPKIKGVELENLFTLFSV